MTFSLEESKCFPDGNVADGQALSNVLGRDAGTRQKAPINKILPQHLDRIVAEAIRRF
jgi:hypothetical protein